MKSLFAAFDVFPTAKGSTTRIAHTLRALNPFSDSLTLDLFGVGYNMTAIASQSPPERTHILFPFRRRFDNQFLRAKRLKNGFWQQQNNNGAQQAAQWILDIIENNNI